MAKTEWKEAELIQHFQLKKTANTSSRMQDWMDTHTPIFSDFEEKLFGFTYEEGRQNITYWSEEDLKMYFIGNILRLSSLMSLDDRGYVGLFEKKLSATVGTTKLSVRADFVVAKGFKNVIEEHYFHFQEYKPQLNPTGEPMAQIIEAFLIGQTKNKKPTPMYGCEVIGKQWTFVLMEGKSYCTSKAYDCTDKDDLLKIIAVLRKFKDILETQLLP